MWKSPYQILRRLPREVQLLILGTFINKMGTFIVPYLAIVLHRDFDLSEAQIGALMAVYGAGTVTAAVTGGYLTDLLGRRRTLWLSLLVSGGLAMSLSAVQRVEVFLPLLVVLGFISDLYRPSSSAIISDLLPSEQRATGYAALRMAVNLGFAFGMSAGGILLDWNWRFLFLGDGLTTAAFGLLVFAAIPETKPPLHAQASAEPPPWRDGVYLQLCFSAFLFCLIFFNHMTALPLTITMRAGYPARVYGLLVGANGLLIALFEVSIVAGLAGRRRLRVASLGTLLIAAGMGVTGFFHHWAGYLLAVIIWTFGEIFTMPQEMSFLADWAPPVSRGRYLGMFQAMWSVSLFLNPLLLLPLHSRLSERTFWLLSGLAVAPGALVLRHLDRVADRPERLRGASPSMDPLPSVAIG